MRKTNQINQAFFLQFLCLFVQLVFGFLGLWLNLSELGECSRTGLLVTREGVGGLQNGVKTSKIFPGLRPFPAA